MHASGRARPPAPAAGKTPLHIQQTRLSCNTNKHDDNGKQSVFAVQLFASPSRPTYTPFKTNRETVSKTGKGHTSISSPRCENKAALYQHVAKPAAMAPTNHVAASCLTDPRSSGMIGMWATAVFGLLSADSQLRTQTRLLCSQATFAAPHK